VQDADGIKTTALSFRTRSNATDSIQMHEEVLEILDELERASSPSAGMLWVIMALAASPLMLIIGVLFALL
jgi:hypothetical protein